MTLKERVLDFYHRHEGYSNAAFFVAGFLFDIATLGRIDDTVNLVQQGVYLLILSLLVQLELKEEFAPSFRHKWILKVWEFREFAVHFIFGSLLSVYTLFFFKSASIESSFFFLIFMSVILIANEMERFQKRGPQLRFVLLSLCWTCYCAYFVPIVMGFLGLLPFLLAIFLSTAIMFLLYRLILLHQLKNTTATSVQRPLFRYLVIPVIVIQSVFFILYIFQLIPPVPLSAQQMGIYHQIEKSQGQYILSYSRPWWKFWQNGDQTFEARPGDKVFMFARIFAPSGFRDELKVRWLYHDPRLGWQSTDAVPIKISGGRDEGFRGFTYKSNYTVGNWMVKLETVDGREIRRIRFEVVEDLSTTPREYSTDIE